MIVNDVRDARARAERLLTAVAQQQVLVDQAGGRFITPDRRPLSAPDEDAVNELLRVGLVVLVPGYDYLRLTTRAADVLHPPHGQPAAYHCPDGRLAVDLGNGSRWLLIDGHGEIMVTFGELTGEAQPLTPRPTPRLLDDQVNDAVLTIAARRLREVAHDQWDPDRDTGAWLREVAQQVDQARRVLDGLPGAEQ